MIRSRNIGFMGTTGQKFILSNICNLGSDKDILFFKILTFSVKITVKILLNSKIKVQMYRTYNKKYGHFLIKATKLAET